MQVQPSIFAAAYLLNQYTQDVLQVEKVVGNTLHIRNLRTMQGTVALLSQVGRNLVRGTLKLHTLTTLTVQA